MVALKLALIASAALGVLQVQSLDVRPSKKDKSLDKSKPKKEKKEKLSFGERLERFFNDEESTTPPPMWNGLPLYYEGKTPMQYWSDFKHMQRQDFFFRIERWHELFLESKSKCRSPKKGEKVVYFVHHCDAVPKEDDASLWELGQNQAANLRFDPLLSKAVSNDPKGRAELIIVSPARKALQTAALGFGDILQDVKWEIDTDVRGFGWVEGTLQPHLGSKALYELSNNRTYAQSAVNLLTQYRDLPEGWDKATKPHKDRWFDFVDHLAARPEHRFIVVTHSGMIKQANITKTHSGEVGIRALRPDKSWRKLSPPDCWPAAS